MNRTARVFFLLAAIGAAFLSRPLLAVEQGVEEFGNQINGIRHLTATEASKVLKQFPAVRVLDVRTGFEFNRGHIEGAVHINYYSFEFRQKLQQLDKETTWLVHCRSGVRSGKSLPILQELGFQSLLHLDGGTLAWHRAGLPLHTD